MPSTATVRIRAPQYRRSGDRALDRPVHRRVLAAYGGVFIAGSVLWGVAFDDFHPDRADIAGALVCLTGVGIIMYAR